MHSSLKVSWFVFFNFDSGSNIKTVKTKENGINILDETHEFINSNLMYHGCG